MKLKYWAAVLALLTLCACAAQETTPPVTPDPPAVEDEATTPPVEEQEVEELPIEIVPSTPLEPLPAEIAWSETVEEDLIEDVVSYAYTLPVFSGFPGAEAVNAYYQGRLMDLQNYALDTVFSETASRHCVATVTGGFTVDGLKEGRLQVTYTVTADYSEGEAGTAASTDYFDLESGENVTLE